MYWRCCMKNWIFLIDILSNSHHVRVEGKGGAIKKSSVSARRCKWKWDFKYLEALNSGWKSFGTGSPSDGDGRKRNQTSDQWSGQSVVPNKEIKSIEKYMPAFFWWNILRLIIFEGGPSRREKYQSSQVRPSVERKYLSSPKIGVQDHFATGNLHSLYTENILELIIHRLRALSWRGDW